jgi:hypothetical protein
MSEETKSPSAASPEVIVQSDLSCESLPRKGDWIQTFSGVEFYPFDPLPSEILIEDIAHALSMQCRYAGHVRRFYSVAEHCVRVAELLPIEDRLWGLLHDASEAYLVDLPRPIKRHSEIGRLYREAEAVLMESICDRFNLAPVEPDSVGVADKAMLLPRGSRTAAQQHVACEMERLSHGPRAPAR